MRQLITNSGQVGEVLRGRRKARRLAQKDLAGKLGISQERLSRLEAAPGTMTLDRLIAIVHLLDFELVIRNKTKTPASTMEW